MFQVIELKFLRHAGAITLSRKCVAEALHIVQTRIQSIAFAECYDDKKLVLMDHHKWDETGQAVSMRKKPLATCFFVHPNMCLSLRCSVCWTKLQI